jgi:NAD(P)-dependent dehydrogenase (short-subunit alcohol dehydrogenase family)
MAAAIRKGHRMELQGKVALVTGAGSGIGKAAAVRLAREGASVGVLSRTEDEIQATVREIEGAGGQAIALVADISDAGQMREAVERLLQTYGRLDLVFANAGINGVWAPSTNSSQRSGIRPSRSTCVAPT